MTLSRNKLPLVSKGSCKPVRLNRNLKGFEEKDNVYIRLILTYKMQPVKIFLSETFKKLQK
jgi:hypothetical protein